MSALWTLPASTAWGGGALMRTTPRGWTLSSLLIALALASLLIVLFAKTLVFVLQTTRQTEQLAQLHQSGQLVFNLFQRELRNANFWAASALSPQNLANLQVQADCRSVDDSGSFASNDQPYQLLRIGVVGDVGTPDCLTNANQHSDYLQIKRLVGVKTGRAGMRANRVYLQQSAQFSNFVTLNSANLPEAAELWPYLHHLFYVSTQYHQGKALPVLMRKRLIRQQDGQLVMDTDALIDGVEMLVFESGKDINNDGVVDQFSNLAPAPVAGIATPSANIVQIRFHVLLRSVEPDPSYTNRQQYQLGARRFTAPGDHFRRLQVSSSVTFIN